MADSRNITNKMYRYHAILQAIDFFTQRFNPEQLGSYSFDFANEILLLNASALFIKEDEEFVLKNKRLYDIDKYSIKNSDKLQRIATFHGNIILNNFENYFEEKDIKFFNMSIVLPLIIHNFVFGFIVADGKAIDTFDEDDCIMAMSLTRLFNNSLENSKNFMDLKEKNKEIDQKIFNLFAINHSAKSLLSELELDKLKNMAIDVFSEIACSKITSFGMYDNITNSIKIMGYRNVSDFSTYLTEFKLNPHIQFSNMKTVLHLDEDKELIKSIFLNWEEFDLLSAQHIILLIKDKLLGLVTLGEPINQTHYDPSMFELIESLASFTYIALQNAVMFEEINYQKVIIERKFKTLELLNQLVNNIKQCISIEELCDVTLKTLMISFGIQKAFIAFQESDGYKIQFSIDHIGIDSSFELNKEWEASFDGDTIYDFSINNIHKYLNSQLCTLFNDSTGLIISPIIINNFDLEANSGPLAYLVVLKTENNLQQEEILLIDTIAKNISPIIYHMKTVDEYKKYRLPDNRKLFLDSLNNKIADRKNYSVDFNVYYTSIAKQPFIEHDFSLYDDYEYYVIDNYLFIISYFELMLENFKKMPVINELEDILTYHFD